jgi:hypothetical protein
MGDMEKEYWVDRTTRKQMTGIKRTMEALKYIAWGEILADKVPSHAMPCHPDAHAIAQARNGPALWLTARPPRSGL